MYSSDKWDVDLKKRLAVHPSGFIVFMTYESGQWRVRRSNAELWIKFDFVERANLVPKLLVSAVTAYEMAFNKKQEKNLK